MTNKFWNWCWAREAFEFDWKCELLEKCQIKNFFISIQVESLIFAIFRKSH